MKVFSKIMGFAKYSVVPVCLTSAMWLFDFFEQTVISLVLFGEPEYKELEF